MSKGRAEAFSDGVVMAIIIIMTMEVKAPHGADPVALPPLFPVLLSDVLSVVFLDIYRIQLL
jgi:uncharacterized membrane protein